MIQPKFELYLGSFFAAALVMILSCGGQAPGVSQSTVGTATPAGSIKRVFVTSTAFTSTGGLAAADTLCLTRATAAGLGGAWVAWLSDSTHDAISRVTDVSPWFLVDKTTQVFASKGQITASGPLVNINRNESGTVATTFGNGVITGTTSGGTKSGNTYSDWTSVGGGVNFLEGDVTVLAHWTTSGTTSSCNLRPLVYLPIYCFEQ